MEFTYKKLAKMIDHSLLHPTMTDRELEAGCNLARKYDVASVCIKPYGVEAASKLLSGSDVLVGTVIAFPHGNSTTGIKVEEASRAAGDGAAEIDMVINIGKALGHDWNYVTEEIGEVNRAVVKSGAILKVIFENDFLSSTEIKELCNICAKLKVAFAKTSTGYGFVKQDNGMYSYQGATLEDLTLMRRILPEEVQVKAAGGVRTLKDLVTVALIGVTRVGATATSAMLDEAKERLDRGENLSELASTF